MQEPERITSPYAPDLGEVRGYLERTIRALRFVELIAAILAFVTRVCEVNGELSKKLAELRQRRPRSESLERLERQLILPLGDLGAIAHRASIQRHRVALGGVPQRVTVGRRRARERLAPLRRPTRDRPIDVCGGAEGLCA